MSFGLLNRLENVLQLLQYNVNKELSYIYAYCPSLANVT